jgi:exodeoxyribonuclease V gamma subunit
VLHLYSADRVGPLAGALAEVLSDPLADPMMSEWIAVPTLGMRRWLALELARSLGVSGPGVRDGIAANIAFPFPGSLRKAVLDAGRDEGAVDPWQVDRLTWAVLDVLHEERDDARLAPITSLPPGATWFGRARSLADLFDRYAAWRPDLLLQWHAGRDIDASGRSLERHDQWQPHLWRLTRARVGEASPPERLPGLLHALRAGTLAIDLPPRLAVFGITTIPNGSTFLELARAVGTQRDLHLFLLDPSPASTARVRALASEGPVPLLRAEDRSEEAMRHPLLRSWGRPYRERTMLLAAAQSSGLPSPKVIGGAVPAARSLLAQVQSDLRLDTEPATAFELVPEDRSIQVHSCHGPARQVEVLRDAILHLLADDPTLREEDIVVLCPSIAQFAPLVEAGFGPSAESGAPPPLVATPRLLYRIADRSLRQSSSVLTALDALLKLISGRCTASEMLEFLSLAAVRQRFDFDDDALSTIADWVIETNAHWGFDGGHRAAWAVGPGVNDNTWRRTIDRVLMGVAVSDDDIGLAPGDIAPLGVEGGDISLAGRLADVVARLSALAVDVVTPRPAAGWCQLLAEVSEQLVDVEDEQSWQLEQLRRILSEIGDEAVIGADPSTVELTLADMRRLLADRLEGAPLHPDFFRGGITISSLTPLRWLPFRVVCVLGFDELGTNAGADQIDGDDLTAQSPHLGDRDPRAEVRQALLEAVLAAGDHLIITRTGRNVRTNQEVPSAVAFAELRDTIASTLSTPEAYRDRIETIHPRQPFDERCFQADALHRSGPWSFDPGALAGADARANRLDEVRPFVDGPLAAQPHEESVIALSELREFLNHPVKSFLRRRLLLHLPRDDGEVRDDLATDLGGLDRWSVATRMLSARLAGWSTTQWARHERALGTLPAGGLGVATLSEIVGEVDALLAAAAALNIDPAREDHHPIDVGLSDTRIVGAVIGRSTSPQPGPATVTYSKKAPKQELAAWLDLMALVAGDPEIPWRSVVVRRTKSGTKVDSYQITGLGETPEDRRANAIAALDVVVDCYRRGQREPIPLFSKLSPLLHLRQAKAGHWNGYEDHGEGDDDAHQLTFGSRTFDDLCALGALDEDPPGHAQGRAHRYADYLWDAVEASAELLT